MYLGRCIWASPSKGILFGCVPVFILGHSLRPVGWKTPWMPRPAGSPACMFNRETPWPRLGRLVDFPNLPGVRNGRSPYFNAHPCWASQKKSMSQSWCVKGYAYKSCNLMRSRSSWVRTTTGRVGSVFVDFAQKNQLCCAALAEQR